MKGLTGNLLRVDLTRGVHSIERIDPAIQDAFLGGRGLAVKIYTNEVSPDVDPLSSENKLIFSAGPLVGTGAICGSTCSIVSKSPLNGLLSLGITRGHFGAEMKFAGFDMIVIEGRSDFPVYLSIIDDRISIKPAMHIWGRTNSSTDALVKEGLDDRWASRDTYTASIGPAGESLSSLSVIVTEGGLQGLGGEGLGAVMGAKNLKAIAVKGRHSIIVSDGNRLMQVVTALNNRIASTQNPSHGLAKFGTAFILSSFKKNGMLTQNNFQRPYVHEEEGGFIDKVISRASNLRRRGCFSCPIGCLKMAKANGKKLIGGFEALTSLGMNIGIKDIDSIDEIFHLCNELGMGPVAMGGALSTAMEIGEMGRPRPEDEWSSIMFGSKEEVLRCIELTAKNRGFGGILSRGGLELARYFNELTAFLGVKGISIPALDLRGSQGLGLNFATSNFGGDYLVGYSIMDEIINQESGVDPREVSGKPELVKASQDTGACFDSLGICSFILLALKPRNILQMVNAVTGMDMKMEDLLNAGERVWNLERSFNLKAGLTGRDDTLPSRFLHEPLQEGEAKGEVCRLSDMLPQYYKLRGWDENGVPKIETLNALGLMDGA